jgi:hypothetical protein
MTAPARRAAAAPLLACQSAGIPEAEIPAMIVQLPHA